jgi:hypothetical protein
MDLFLVHTVVHIVPQIKFIRFLIKKQSFREKLVHDKHLIRGIYRCECVFSKTKGIFIYYLMIYNVTQDRRVLKKLHGLSPRANYTDRATAASRRSDCQRLWIEGAT